MSSNIITIYADGGCRGNPGIGGWGAYIKCGGHSQELYGGEKNTTNNRMELMAVISAIGSLEVPSVATVYTDSQYVQKGISQWIHKWKINGWQTSDKKPVKNADLWQRLDELANKHSLKWNWVKGHNGNSGNEHADRLANLGMDELK